MEPVSVCADSGGSSRRRHGRAVSGHDVRLRRLHWSRGLPVGSGRKTGQGAPFRVESDRIPEASTLFDQPGDMFVGQSRLKHFVPSREVRTKTGPKWIFAKCSHCSSAWTRTGFVGRSSADFDLTPACLGVERQQRAFLQDFDPAADVRRVVLAHIQSDNF